MYPFFSSSMLNNCLAEEQCEVELMPQHSQPLNLWGVTELPFSDSRGAHSCMLPYLVPTSPKLDSIPFMFFFFFLQCQVKNNNYLDNWILLQNAFCVITRTWCSNAERIVCWLLLFSVNFFEISLCHIDISKYVECWWAFSNFALENLTSFFGNFINLGTVKRKSSTYTN